MNDEAKKVLDEIDDILKIDRKELYGAERLGEFSFEERGKEQFESVFKLLEELRRRDLTVVPTHCITNAQHRIHEFKESCKRAQELNKEAHDPRSERDRIVQLVSASYQELFNHFSQFIDFTIQASDISRKMENEAGQALSLIKEKDEEATKLLDLLKSRVAGVAIAKNAAHYRGINKKHAKAAKLWLIAGGSLSALLLLVVVGLYCKVYHGREGEFIFGYQEVAILFGFVLLLYAIIFCNKNFNAAKHNEVINDNKATALATFPIFDGGARDKSTKDQILLHAATFIFSNTTTGFSKDQGSMSFSPTLEVVKRVTRQMESKS